MGLTKTETEIMVDMLLIFSAISLVSCVLLMTTHLSFPQRRFRFPHDCLFWLTVCLAVLAVSFFFTPEHEVDPDTVPKGLCTAQAVLQQMGDVGAVLWYAIHAYVMYASIVQNISFETLATRRVYFHTIAWSSVVILTIVPGVGRAYNESGVWCWIGPPAWQFACFFIPLVMIILYASVLLLLVIRHVLRNGMNMHRKVMLRLVLFITLFVVTWSIMVADRTYSALHNEEPLPALKLAHAVVEPLQGFFVLVVMGLTKGNYRLWSGAIRRKSFRHALDGRSEVTNKEMQESFLKRNTIKL